MSESALSSLLQALPAQHRSALEWFEKRAGQETSWPGALDDGTLLATRAKGIYKPAWSRYALSVRQSLNSPYPDRSVVHGHGGSWTYDYFQENLDPNSRDDAFTNQGLMNCWRDVVPVGVFLQTRLKPNPLYKVLGLALVNGWGYGYFTLEGIRGWVASDSAVHRAPFSPTDHPQDRADAVAEGFNPSGLADERKRVIASISVRQGQAGFRRGLLDAYGGRCAITGYDAEDSLEAAHIVAYRGPVTNHLSNGLLLRADLHTLFDLHLVTVDVATTTLLLSPDVQATQYSRYQGAELALPENSLLRPSLAALRQHRAEAQF